ncbi:hypothetical protein JTB14_023714 [Gonioctena quinquepunctata]|nr:hypothetical protein JTB14_023714 [Gonioctena quinquepunctata]
MFRGNLTKNIICELWLKFSGDMMNDRNIKLGAMMLLMAGTAVVALLQEKRKRRFKVRLLNRDKKELIKSTFSKFPLYSTNKNSFSGTSGVVLVETEEIKEEESDGFYDNDNSIHRTRQIQSFSENYLTVNLQRLQVIEKKIFEKSGSAVNPIDYVNSPIGIITQKIEQSSQIEEHSGSTSEKQDSAPHGKIEKESELWPVKSTVAVPLNIGTKYSCLYCGEYVANFSRHLYTKHSKEPEDQIFLCLLWRSLLNFVRYLFRKHSGEPEVINILSKPKRTKERLELVTVLRKRGNFLKNTDTASSL